MTDSPNTGYQKRLEMFKTIHGITGFILCLISSIAAVIILFMILSAGDSVVFLIGCLFILCLAFLYWLGQKIIQDKFWPILVLAPVILALWVVWWNHASHGIEVLDRLNRSAINIFITFSIFLFFFTFSIIYLCFKRYSNRSKTQ